MRKRKPLILLACVIGIVVAIALFTQSGQPKYKGRTFESWAMRCTGSRSPIVRIPFVDSRLKPPSDEETIEAEDAIRHIGTNALPILLQWIRYEPGIQSDLSSKDQWRAEFTAAGFWLLGQDAAPAIPDLVKLMNDRSHATSSLRAIEALGLIGTNAIPALLTNLTNPDAPNRVRVAQAFGRFPLLATNGHAAVPILMQCLQDKDLNVRYGAADSLGEMKLQPELVVAALTNSVTATNSGRLRIFVYYALGKYGKQAAATAEFVRSGLNDSDRDVRDAAATALGKIAPELLTNAPPN